MIIKAKYKGFCITCHFTFFKGESIDYNGRAKHLDCIAALTDKSPRTMDKKYKEIYGDVSRKTMRDLLNNHPAKAGAVASHRSTY